MRFVAAGGSVGGPEARRGGGRLRHLTAEFRWQRQ